MPRPRKELIALENTPDYHVYSRCVRRSHICGVDPISGIDYSYRRDEIEARLLYLGDVFAIDICAYAIMSNHHHEVLHVDQESAKAWSDAEVVRRWHMIYKGNQVSRHFEAGNELSDRETYRLNNDIALWRERLYSISWFMRALNEPTARRANIEDECTGKFFESRFHSRALLDVQALITCMVYADANVIRAGLAKTPEDSEHTSIQNRIEAAKQGTIPSQLMCFQGAENRYNLPGLPFANKDYIELVEWTCRQIHPNKIGFIPCDTPPILQRLKISERDWIELSQHFERDLGIWIGNEESLRQLASKNAMQHIGGSRRCRQAFAA